MFPASTTEESKLVTENDANVLFISKAVAVFGSTLLSVVFGLIPIKILWSLTNAYYGRGKSPMPDQYQKRWSVILCALTCFAGGVFIGTSMLSMIPELQVHFNCMKTLLAPYKSYDALISYPWPEFTASMGFFIVFFIEELTLFLLKTRHVTKNRRQATSDVHVTEEETVATSEPKRDTLSKRKPSDATSPCSDFIEPPIYPHAHSHVVRTVVIMLTLSFHTVVESMRYELHSSADAVWTLFWSSNIHHSVVAFALGTQLARTHRRNVAFVISCVCLFSLCIPLGFLFGFVLQQAEQRLLREEAILVVLEGLAVGAFLYVTFYEVLSHELNNEHPSFLKLLCISLGCSVIAALSYFDRRHARFGEEVHKV